MGWPLSQDYNEAIQNPAQCFADAELRQGEVESNALGLPAARSGNFADVYAVVTGSRKWAVKCFTRQIPGLQERYQQISLHLNQVKLPFMVDFTFLDKGIRVRSDWYPILKMQWVEGFTLNQFVKNSLDKPQTLDLLCQLWVKLARRLREANIAHCDLQHGNVLLVPASRAGTLQIKLVDYDGMCVPSLTLLKSIEVGHPAYQHPQRQREGIYSLEVDRFSHLVIYTALRALIAGGKTLWDKYDDGDNLLFRPADYQAPTKSRLLYELLKSPGEESQTLVKALMQSLSGPLDQVPLLDQLAPAGTTGIKTATSLKRSAARAESAPAAAAPVEEVFASATREGSPRSQAAPPKSRLMPALVGGVVGFVACVAVASWLILTRGSGHDETGPKLVQAEPEKRPSPSPAVPTHIQPTIPKRQETSPPVKILPVQPPDVNPAPVNPPPVNPAPVNPPPMVPGKDASLVLRVNEPRPEVYVDDAKAEPSWDPNGTSAELHLEPGARKITVKKEGFAKNDKTLTLVQGQRLFLFMHLQRIDAVVRPNPPPGIGPVAFTSPSNWIGYTKYWTVKDGTIFGSFPESPVTRNVFLCSRSSYRDFELSFQVRVSPGGNSGLQFRSHRVNPQSLAVAGPQVDLGDRVLAEGVWGNLYDEPIGPIRKVNQANLQIKKGDFNTCVVRCVGKHVKIAINGTVTIDDDFPAIPDQGIIAWQMRESMDVTVKGIEFKDLSGPDVANLPRPAIPPSNNGKPAPPMAPKTAKLLPVPAQAEIEAAERLVKQEYQKEFAQPKPPDDLATRLFRQGQKVKDDPARQYVLLRDSRDLAIKTGEPDLVVMTIEELAKNFTIEEVKEKAAALEGVEKSTRGSKNFALIVEAVARTLKEAAEAEEFELAHKLLALGSRSSDRTKDKKALAEYRAARKEMLALEEQYKKVAADIEKLQANPADPEVNLAVGRYRFFHKNEKEKEKGLPLLAKGSDPQLAELATKELEKPQKAEAQMALAEGWRKDADSATTPSGKKGSSEKTEARRRAFHWYLEALPQLEGKQLAKANAALKNLAREVPGLMRPWIGFDTSQAEERQGALFLKPGASITSRPLYSGNLTISLTVQAEQHSLAITAFEGAALEFKTLADREMIQLSLNGRLVSTTSFAAVRRSPFVPLTPQVIEWRFSEQGVYVSVNGRDAP